jgi:hypothetical protein
MREYLVQPVVVGPATFTLPLSGVTAETTITQATFSFGTMLLKKDFQGCP